MIDCCNGHTVSLLVYAQGLAGNSDNYIAWLNEGEAVGILAVIEEGDCPICSGLIPFQKEVVR